MLNCLLNLGTMPSFLAVKGKIFLDPPVRKIDVHFDGEIALHVAIGAVDISRADRDRGENLGTCVLPDFHFEA